jgi:ferredoxin-type protein NapH
MALFSMRQSKTAQFIPTARLRSAALLWWLLPAFLVVGWFYPIIGLFLLVCMAAPVAVATVQGRSWCGWACPRGSFFDYIMERFSRNKPAPAWLRRKPFRLGVLTFMMTMVAIQVTLAWPNFEAIGRFFITMLAITTVVGIGLALAYRPRTWCTICPSGTMASWFARGKKPLNVNSACKSCSICAKVCPMDLTPHEADPSHADCIKCERCIQRCPPKALAFGTEQTASPPPRA